MALRWLAGAICLLALATAAGAAPPDTLWLEELTWVEVRDAVRAGTTTIIVPVGGTEQNGPHMSLGKHNVRVRLLAGRIAAKLGHALVAPVVSYVPEGGITPPAGHMRFAGTISVPDAAFRAILDGAARSFRQHGFVDIVLIGDSGNYQAQLGAVAAQLNRAWAGTPARAHFIAEYYRATLAPYRKALRDKGLSEAQIGTHAGAADTALSMALDAALVRPDQLAPAAQGGADAGVEGDPRVASAALGQFGVELIVLQTVSAIRQAMAARR
jgi:creatinine amidohydrolase